MTEWASQMYAKMRLNDISITNLAQEMHNSRQMVSRTLNSQNQTERAKKKIEIAVARLVEGNDT